MTARSTVYVLFMDNTLSGPEEHSTYHSRDEAIKAAQKQSENYPKYWWWVVSSTRIWTHEAEESDL